MLIKELTQLSGVSGFEDEVRAFLKEHIHHAQVSVDCMGNLICHKAGKGKRVMVAAHMDEVGLIITKITDDGYLKFDAVGGIETAVLSGKRVYIGGNKIPGVTDAKAVHLQSRAEMGTPLKIKDMSIDIGASSKEEAEQAVSPGDYAVFDSPFKELESGYVKSKALDDRVGCAVLLELMEEEYESDMYFVFTTQEEVGLRGAKTAAYQIKPDIALVIEGTTCTDVSGSIPEEYVTTTGRGAVMTALDGAAVSNKAYFDYIKRISKEYNIPLQIKRTTAGGTDAGAIAYSCGGAKTAVLAVPCRYIHSPVSVMQISDAENVLRLSREVLKNIERSGI